MTNIQPSSGRPASALPHPESSVHTEAESSTRGSVEQAAQAMGDLGIQPRGARSGTSPAGEAYSPNSRMVPRLQPGLSNKDIMVTRGYHSLLMTAYKSQVATERLYDGQFLRDLVKAENARHPGLELAVCSVGMNDSLRDWGVHDAMRKAVERPGEPHSCVLTDDDTHAAAMSIQALGSPDPTTLSIVVLDSIKPKEEDLPNVKLHKALRSKIDESLNNDAALKGLKIQITIVPMGVQVSIEGCNLFALVAAKKAATSKSVKDLHAWGHEMLGRAAPGIHALEVGLEPEMLLEPEFFKHAMKRDLIESVLEEAGAMRQDAPVNRKGDSLLGRFEKYERDTTATTQDGLVFDTRYSRSYEEKRLDKFARLIEHKQAQLAEQMATSPAGPSTDPA